MAAVVRARNGYEVQHLTWALGAALDHPATGAGRAAHGPDPERQPMAGGEAMSTSAPCRKCGQYPQARGTGWCAACLAAEDARRAALAPPRMAGADLAARVCEWCGGELDGYGNRRTCSTRCRVALHRHGGIGPFSAGGVTPSPTPTPGHGGRPRRPAERTGGRSTATAEVDGVMPPVRVHGGP